jgi:hypothetical protein
MKKFSIPLFSVFIALFVYIPSGACSDLKLSGVRQPAVAGQFYPSDPAKLGPAIRQFLNDSPAIPMEDPLAVIVPHAGYIYSGQICADAFRQVMKSS